MTHFILDARNSSFPFSRPFCGPEIASMRRQGGPNGVFYPQKGVILPSKWGYFTPKMGVFSAKKRGISTPLEGVQARVWPGQRPTEKPKMTSAASASWSGGWPRGGTLARVYHGHPAVTVDNATRAPYMDMYAGSQAPHGSIHGSSRVQTRVLALKRVLAL